MSPSHVTNEPQLGAADNRLEKAVEVFGKRPTDDMGMVYWGATHRKWITLKRMAGIDEWGARTAYVYPSASV